MQDMLNWFMGNKDTGGTPYKAALDKVEDVILALQNIDDTTKYIVVFLSDGRPDPIIQDSALKAEIRQVTDLHAGRVSFNTVYYGPKDSSNGERMKMMAEVGGGNFLDTNDNSTGGLFSISDLVVVPGEVCE